VKKAGSFAKDPLREFEKNLTHKQRLIFRGLTSPEKIQRFLDSVRYSDSDTYFCPLTLVKKNYGGCFEGALFAAVVFRRLGHPSLIVEMTSENDDDHILAVYKKNGSWGAVAKSIFPGLRSRQPVYRTVRELVMSYFEFYYNLKRKRTLRGFSAPLDLKKLDKKEWMTSDGAIVLVGKALDKTTHFPLFPTRIGRKLARTDPWTFKAGMLGTDRSKVYRP
jgi:hypothetical protein